MPSHSKGESGAPSERKLVRCARVGGGAPPTRASLGSWPSARCRAAEERDPACGTAASTITVVPHRFKGYAARGEACDHRASGPARGTTRLEATAREPSPVRPFASFTRRKPGSSSSTRTVVPSWISKWLALFSPGPSRAETEGATTTARWHRHAAAGGSAPGQRAPRGPLRRNRPRRQPKPRRGLAPEQADRDQHQPGGPERDERERRREPGQWPEQPRRRLGPSFLALSLQMAYGRAPHVRRASMRLPPRRAASRRPPFSAPGRPGAPGGRTRRCSDHADRHAGSEPQLYDDLFRLRLLAVRDRRSHLTMDTGDIVQPCLRRATPMRTCASRSAGSRIRRPAAPAETAATSTAARRSAAPAAMHRCGGCGDRADRADGAAERGATERDRAAARRVPAGV